MRRAVVAITGVALCLALTSCRGPVSTHSVTIDVDCTLSFGSGPPTVTTATLHLSVGNAAFASPGAEVTFPNLTMDGEPTVPAEYPIGIFVNATGLTPFPQPALPPQIQAILPTGSEFMGNGYEPGTDFGSQSATITGAVGSTATIDLAAVLLVGYGPTDLGLCTPHAGQGTRLASVPIVADLGP
jgi:hypothetical protein